jgi:DNA-binding MurR/RpiR family transcriptional regulator
MKDEDGASLPPRDLGALRSLVVETRRTLPPRLIQAAAFALENPEEIALGTAASVAAQASVQPSTLIRLAKRLGYSGFSAMQDVFRAELKSNWPDYRERIAKVQEERRASGLHPLISGFAESAIVSLERLVSMEIDDDIRRAAKILARARVVYLIGMRRAFPVTFYMAYALGKLGLRAVLVDDVAGLGPEQLTEAGKHDALVAVSFTPYTPMTVELTERAADHGVPVIALTDSALSPLSPKATIKFEIPEADYAGFRSLSATLCVAMTLTVAAATERKQT